MKIASAAKTSEIRQHPLHSLKWVDPSTLYSNTYNPNRVFGPEMRLLKISILEDGWTQPIVAQHDGEIVDGFHRWTLGSKDEDIRKASNNLVPVVFLAKKDEGKQMLSTIRHNRARGQHGILKMGNIMRRLKALGYDDNEIEHRLQMDSEELERLISMEESPDTKGSDSFGAGWVPDAGKAG